MGVDESDAASVGSKSCTATTPASRGIDAGSSFLPSIAAFSLATSAGNSAAVIFVTVLSTSPSSVGIGVRVLELRGGFPFSRDAAQTWVTMNYCSAGER